MGGEGEGYAPLSGRTARCCIVHSLGGGGGGERKLGKGEKGGVKGGQGWCEVS